MRLGSFCTGVAGLELGLARVLDFTTVWHCEFDKDASKVLEARFPDVHNYGDLTKVDWEEVALGSPVDIVTAGYP